MNLALGSFASFANISYQALGCLFILFVVSFAVQKLVTLIRAHMFIFAFISFAVIFSHSESCLFT